MLTTKIWPYRICTLSVYGNAFNLQVKFLIFTKKFVRVLAFNCWQGCAGTWKGVGLMANGTCTHTGHVATSASRLHSSSNHLLEGWNLGYLQTSSRNPSTRPFCVNRRGAAFNCHQFLRLSTACDELHPQQQRSHALNTINNRYALYTYIHIYTYIYIYIHIYICIYT